MSKVRRKVAPVITVTESNPSSRELFAQRMRMMDEVRSAEYEFTRRPNHLSAAKLTALRHMICEVEMQIVDLDLNHINRKG